MIWLAAAGLLAWIYLLTLHGRFWQAGPQLTAARPQASPSIAVVVPARDEAAHVGDSVGSLLAQDYAGPLRIVLVDDNSTDGTAARALALPDPSGRLTVLIGAPRPAGWAGKLWAVHQGVAAASDAEWLLLTDADIVHDAAHVATLMAQAERVQAAMVSEMVALRCADWPERALIPAFVYLFQLLYPFSRVNDAGNRTAAAAGGTVLICRAALERAGGIGAIRGALIDDVALARAVKPSGRIWLGHSALARSIRPYPEFRDIWRMVARSAYVQLRHSPLLLAATTLGLALVFLVAPAMALLAPYPASALGLAGWAMMAASFVPTLRRFRLSWLWAPLLPAIAAFYMAATIGSAWDHHRGRGVVWKNRSYTEESA